MNSGLAVCPKTVCPRFFPNKIDCCFALSGKQRTECIKNIYGTTGGSLFSTRVDAWHAQRDMPFPGKTMNHYLDWHPRLIHPCFTNRGRPHSQGTFSLGNHPGIVHKVHCKSEHYPLNQSWSCWRRLARAATDMPWSKGRGGIWQLFKQ